MPPAVRMTGYVLSMGALWRRRERVGSIRKVFFFEKKNQKTFGRLVARQGAQRSGKSFLLLFFQNKFFLCLYVAVCGYDGRRG
jgi:hypothetical protein